MTAKKENGKTENDMVKKEVEQGKGQTTCTCCMTFAFKATCLGLANFLSKQNSVMGTAQYKWVGDTCLGFQVSMIFCRKRVPGKRCAMVY